MSWIKYLGWYNDNARSTDIPRSSGTIFDYSCAMRMNGRLLDLPPQYLDAVARAARAATARVATARYPHRGTDSRIMHEVIKRFDGDDLLHKPNITC